MYEAYLEFPEGWGGGGGLRNNPFRGGSMDIFWNYTMTLHGNVSFEFYNKSIHLTESYDKFQKKRVVLYHLSRVLLEK